MAEDVTVPRGNIPNLIKKCKEMAKKYDVEIVVLGHAGDGNLHPAVLTDPKNKDHYERALKAMDGIIEDAVELGGVLSGEHGIGLEKQKFFRQGDRTCCRQHDEGYQGTLRSEQYYEPGQDLGLRGLIRERSERA